VTRSEIRDSRRRSREWREKRRRRSEEE